MAQMHWAHAAMINAKIAHVANSLPLLHMLLWRMSWRRTVHLRNGR